MEFALFLLVNVALFLRPQDLFPALAAVPIYNILIVLNLLIAAPLIVRHFQHGLRTTPATVCVVGVLMAIVLSLAARAEFGGALYWGSEFLKVVAYFVLMVAVLNTPRRFALYLTTIVGLTVALTLLCVAHFQGYIELPSIRHALEGTYDASDGSTSSIYRLAAFGVFADPNDLSMIVVLSMLICLGGICFRHLGPAHFAFVVPLLFLGYALALTQSRGGLIALLVGLAAFMMNRYGAVRTVATLAVIVPLLLIVFGGRQADISGSIGHGTGGQRTDLWYAGLQMIKFSPLVGIGHAHFVEEEGLVAHNSYVQALAEWGLFGGTMFIGLFYVVLISVWRLKSVRKQIQSSMLRNMQPYVLGALAAYAASMLTLTRCDVVPTYLVAGIGVSFERLARRGTRSPRCKHLPACCCK